MSARLALTALAVVAVVFSASCSNLTGSHANQVREWASAASYTSLADQINADRTGLANGERLGNLKALRTACAGFAQDAGSLEGELPTPDVTLSNELGTGLTDYYSAGTDCFAASSYHDTSYRHFLTELQAGDTLYRKAEKRLVGFGVR